MGDLRAARRRQILEAAATVFADRGYDRARMDQIAEEAGLSKGTVYGYFEDKEDLFFELMVHVLEQFGRAMGDAPGADTWAGRVRSMTLAALLWCDGDEQATVLLMEFWSASASLDRREEFFAVFRNVYDRSRAELAAMLRQGIAAGEFRADADADAAASGIIALVDGLLLQSYFRSLPQPEQALGRCLDMLLDGLAPQRP